MQKIKMKYTVLLCIMMGTVFGCSGKVEEKSIGRGISTKLSVTEQVTEIPVGMGATETSEEKPNTAEWVYDAPNYRLTIRGTGETHDRELPEPVDCDCKYHVEALPYLEGAGSWKKEKKIRESIKEVVVEQGITVLNMAAFADLT